MDGSMGTANFQVGANAGQLISMTGSNFTTSTYGNNRLDASSMQAAAGTSNGVAAGTMTINGSSGSKDVDVAVNATAKTTVAAINKVSGDTGVTATAKTEANLVADAGKSFTFEVKGDNAEAVKVSFSIGTDDANGHAAAISAFNAQSAKTGITASYDDAGGLKLTHADGADISVVNASSDTTATATLGAYDEAGVAIATPITTAGATDGATVAGRIVLDSENSFSVADASGFALDGGDSTGSSALKSVADLDISTFEGAQMAIKTADAALASVNSQRAQYGALQSRFESAISNLSSSTENLSASRSRIVDTDFASETANMTRGQILQQAGTSMLAQANSLPNGVLSLLRG